MKQKYIHPTTMVHMIQVNHSILQSSTRVGVSKSNYDEGTGTILGRRDRGSDWDDEEE